MRKREPKPSEPRLIVSALMYVDGSLVCNLTYFGTYFVLLWGFSFIQIYEYTYRVKCLVGKVGSWLGVRYRRISQ